MKYPIVCLCLLILAACNKTQDHSGHEMDHDGDDPNQALYNQVMEIHNEVMPKMEDLYKYRLEFVARYDTKPDLTPEKKKEYVSMVHELDSANSMMMGWMHDFRPPSDSTDAEIVREYYETEIEKMKKVRDFTNETLDKAKTFAK